MGWEGTLKCFQFEGKCVVVGLGASGPALMVWEEIRVAHVGQRLNNFPFATSNKCAIAIASTVANNVFLINSMNSGKREFN